MTSDSDPDLLRLTRFWEARGREDAVRYSVPGGMALSDDAFRESGEALLEAAHELVGWTVEPTASVVDVGCGAGRLTGALASRVGHVAAYDIAGTMVAAARERLGHVENVHFDVADAGDLSWQETYSADAVVLLGVLPHLLDMTWVADALAEASRVLVVGGSALFDVRCAPVPMTLPGEELVPPYVARHPIWQGSSLPLETLAAVAHQEDLEIERIAGSESGRALVLARRI